MHACMACHPCLRRPHRQPVPHCHWLACRLWQQAGAGLRTHKGCRQPSRLAPQPPSRPEGTARPGGGGGPKLACRAQRAHRARVPFTTHLVDLCSVGDRRSCGRLACRNLRRGRDDRDGLCRCLLLQLLLPRLQGQGHRHRRWLRQGCDHLQRLRVRLQLRPGPRNLRRAHDPRRTTRIQWDRRRLARAREGPPRVGTSGQAWAALQLLLGVRECQSPSSRCSPLPRARVVGSWPLGLVPCRLILSRPLVLGLQ